MTCPIKGKIRYRTENAARAALVGIVIRGNRKERQVYACPACKGWHLTSQRRLSA